MANEKKMTKVQAFTLAKEIVAVSGNPQASEIVTKLDAELAQLAKKNANGSAKSAEKASANAQLSAKIVEYMAPGTEYSTTDLIKGIADLSEMSTQRVRPLLTPLLDAGTVESHKVKGKVLFYLAGTLASDDAEASEKD